MSSDIKPSDMDKLEIIQAEVIKSSKPRCPFCRTEMPDVSISKLTTFKRLEKENNFDGENFQVQCENCQSLFMLKVYLNPKFLTKGIKQAEALSASTIEK